MVAYHLVTFDLKNSGNKLILSRKTYQTTDLISMTIIYYYRGCLKAVAQTHPKIVCTSSMEVSYYAMLLLG